MFGASGVPRFIKRTEVLAILVSNVLFLVCKLVYLFSIKKYFAVCFQLIYFSVGNE